MPDQQGMKLISIFFIIFNLNLIKAEEESPFSPISLEVDLPPGKVRLGEALFHDPILSRDQKISCSSCHDLSKGGDDGRRIPIGINGSIGDINTPTVFNSHLNFKQFWDGRVSTLEEQINEPMTNPKEMGANWNKVINRLKKEDSYLREFNKIYPTGINKENIVNAIATFERSLATPNSKFDRFLRGEVEFTLAEKRGYELFTTYGCVSCHQGRGLGGNMFQYLGVMKPYYKKKDKLKKSDLGHFNVTQNPEDLHVFKVPSLRNVEVTAPYFHNGSAETLEEAVQVMGDYQLGVKFSEEEISSIVQFLKTLTGFYKGKKLSE